MSTLMQASHQWASRPSDQRFVNLHELHAYVQGVKDNSAARVLSSRALQAVPTENDRNGLALTGPNGHPVNMTHWSFGQLAVKVGAPANYLRSLPGAMAADCLNYGLFKNDAQDLGILLHKDNGNPMLRAVTGPNYGRVWNATITRALVERFGDGLSGDFRIPGEFGEQVAITKDNTTLYASDRDMFVFLADERHRIELPNRRDGQTGSLARGFFVWNSETGSQTLGVSTFLFDYVCCNRIVWGARNVEEFRIRHTSKAPDRWLEEVAPALEMYAQSSTRGLLANIEAARSARVDDVDKFLAQRFAKNQVAAIKAAHMADEQRPIETLWDAATGATAYARAIPFQDTRIEIEREAGRILEMAA